MLWQVSVGTLTAIWGLAFLALLGVACGGPEPCNGDERLCGRTFDQVSFASTHNAMASAEAGWPAPNHKYGPARQLQDGVRALMLDLYYWNGEVTLCHSQCGLGNIPFAQFLTELRLFLEQHPREVVTLILESYVKRVDVALALVEARLEHLVHSQAAATPWPTIQGMLDGGKRLVILSDREGGSYSWYLDVWAHSWETDWNNKTPADLDCRRNRGKANNRLFILNHFISAPFPSD